MSRDPNYKYSVGERVKIIADGISPGTRLRSRLYKGDYGTVFALTTWGGSEFPVIWADADGPLPVDAVKEPNEIRALTVCYDFIEPLPALEQLARVLTEDPLAY